MNILQRIRLSILTFKPGERKNQLGLRVFYTGAFTGPRQFNWIIGLVLFASVLLSNFTGYLLPSTVLLAFCAGFYWLVKKIFKANNNEAIQAMFTLIVTAFVVLTMIGVWFRGAGMQLGWAA